MIFYFPFIIIVQVGYFKFNNEPNVFFFKLIILFNNFNKTSIYDIYYTNKLIK